MGISELLVGRTDGMTDAPKKLQHMESRPMYSLENGLSKASSSDGDDMDEN